MKLHVKTREVQGLTVLDLSGRLVMGEECAILREQVKQLLAANKKKILRRNDDESVCVR